MKTKRGNMKKEKGIALFEMFLMIMATVAIAFILQQSFGMVSAVDPDNSMETGGFVKSNGQLQWVARENLPDGSKLYLRDANGNVFAQGKTAGGVGNVVGTTGSNGQFTMDPEIGSVNLVDGSSFVNPLSTSNPVSNPTGVNTANTFSPEYPVGYEPGTGYIGGGSSGGSTDIYGSNFGGYISGKPIDFAGPTPIQTPSILPTGAATGAAGAAGTSFGGLTKSANTNTLGFSGRGLNSDTTVTFGSSSSDIWKGNSLAGQQFKASEVTFVPTSEGGANVMKNGDKIGSLDKAQYNDVKDVASTNGLTMTKQLTGAEIGKGLFEGIGYAVLVFGAVQLLAGAFGAKENMKLALSASLAIGVLAWKATSTFAQGKSQFWGGTGAIVVGLAAAALVFFLLYKDEQQKIVDFQCQPYQPPLGGSQCEECNKYPFKPCSEYRCKSLGQACELLNVGTGSESCAWVSKFDVKSPIISTLNNSLYPTNLKYNPDTSRPSGLGSKIVRNGGANNCLPAYAPLKFGITTNEPSQCKIDYVHTSSFKNMTFMFGESSLFLYNHTQQMKLPAPETSTNLSGSPLLKNDGTYSLYVRCQDANGNENVDEYTFGFCVDPSPDTTPPIVQASSIISGSPVQFNVSSVPIQIYTDEPATCKWSRTNKDYIDMENNMSCSNLLMKVNSDLVYPCSSNLTAVKNKEDNTFYFRCKDQPNKPEKDRNVMAQSYSLLLRGSQPLNILRAGPNETIYGSTDITTVNLTIETDDGADEGNAWCSYSPSGARDSYVLMYETNNSFMHKQQLDLASGNYTYYYRCIDNGGNRAETNVTFNVFVDRAMPQVTRAYKEMPDALKIVTNEDAQCAYSLTSCNFNFSDGKAMIYNPPEIKNVLLAEWKDNNVYYIKCMDFYGNEPSPNQCNVVISAAKLSGGN